MLVHIITFAVAIYLLARGATLSTKYAEALAKSLHLSSYTVGFIIVGIICILPETFISFNAVLEGIPSFGLGTLLGSNVADLTLIFALIVLFSGRNLKVEGKIIKNDSLYPFLFLLPVALGLDGYFSRIDGAALLISGIVFYYVVLKDGRRRAVSVPTEPVRVKNAFMLLFGMAVLFVGAHFTVTSATSLAFLWGMSPVLIGMLVVSLGTTIPELLFSLKSVKQGNDALAIGDILGSVLADATVVIGILALLQPFAFPKAIIYVAGVFMVISAFILFSFMRSGRVLTKREAFTLCFFWLTFVLVQFVFNG